MRSHPLSSAPLPPSKSAPKAPRPKKIDLTWALEKAKLLTLKFQVMIPQYRPFLKIGHTQEELNTSEEQIK